MPKRLHRRPGGSPFVRGPGLHRRSRSLLGTFWVTRRIVRTRCDGRSRNGRRRTRTSATPSLPRGEWPKMLLVLWGVGAALLTTLYGLQDTDVHPAVRSLGDRLSAASSWPPRCYLLTEFALRPVAAQALEAGLRRHVDSPPASWADTMTVWLLSARACRCRHPADRGIRAVAAEPDRDPARVSP